MTTFIVYCDGCMNHCSIEVEAPDHIDALEIGYEDPTFCGGGDLYAKERRWLRKRDE